MSLLRSNSSPRAELTRLRQKLEDARRHGLRLWLFFVASVALFVVILLGHYKGPIQELHAEILSEIIEKIMDGIIVAIIIYYLIERKLMDIRREMEEGGSYKTNVLAAIFNADLDSSTVMAFKEYIVDEKFRPTSTLFDVYITKTEDGRIKLLMILEENFIALSDFDDKKSSILGPGDGDIFSLRSLKIRNRTNYLNNREYGRGDGPVVDYEFKVKKNDDFTRTAELEKIIASKIIEDNHVFMDGSRKPSLKFHIDKNMLNKEESISPILPKIAENGSVHRLGDEKREEYPGTNFASVVCEPNCMFLPYQGFTYRIVTI
jgi:hypothetical protein